MKRILAVASIVLVCLRRTTPVVDAWTKKETAHGKTVISYYASWQWYDREQLAKPSSMDHSKVTRYNFAFFQTDEKGNIWGTDSWADAIVLFGDNEWSAAEGDTKYCSWDTPKGPPNCAAHKYDTGLIHLAHEAGVEVYPSIGGWTLSNNFPKMAADAKARVTFATNCVKLIEAYDFDGIDIDWEYPGYKDHMGTPADTVNYSLFLAEIKNALTQLGTKTGKTYGLTAALPCGGDNIANIQVDVVSKILDELNLMTYDVHGTWNNVTGANAPLYDMDGSPDLSVHSCVELWKAGGGSTDQINIGLPFYGRSFAGEGITKFGQKFDAKADDIAWSEDEGSPQYFNIMAKAGEFTAGWDDQTKTAFAYSSSGFVSYDDERAICEKTQYAMDNKLNGYIIWEASGDLMPDLSTPLLDAVTTKLNDPTTPCDSTAISEGGESSAGNDSGGGVWVDGVSVGDPWYSVLDIRPWFPDPDATLCVADGKHADNWVESSNLYTSSQVCCAARYSGDKVVACLLESTAVNEVKWYPNPPRCTSTLEIPAPSYMKKFFNSEEECCKKHYCEPKTSTTTAGKWYSTGNSCISKSPPPSTAAKFYLNVAACCKENYCKPPVAVLPTPTSPGIAILPQNPTPTSPGTSPTLITVSSPNSDSSQSYYPDYSASSGECRNDGNAPDWIIKNMMKTSKLDCCESYFFPSSLEECKSDHPFYPNFRDKTCANDGNQPLWMSGSYLVETMNLCCENFFRDDQSRLACLG